jgi:hypothetical protein
MEQLCYETVPEPNTKNLGNSPRFPSHTHTTLSAKWFENYRILTINVAAEFRLWKEQWQDGSYLLGLGLAETPEVPNTKRYVTLSAFRWSTKRSQTVSDFWVTDIRNSTGCWIEIPEKNWPSYTNQVFGKILPCPSQKIVYKNVANEPSFLLVTHMIIFDIWLDRYEFLKSDFAAEQILDRLTIQALDQVFGPQDE